MKKTLLTGTILAGLTIPSAAFAQDADMGRGAADSTMVDETRPAARQSTDIVVTARQREESLQDVPLAVTALGGEFLEQAQAAGIDSVEKYIPNVELGSHPFTGGGLSASIRGVSFGDLDRSFEPAVAVAVDGVFFASNTGALTDTFDVEQIEVLRGPQGTLFGRNTIGGVINIKRTKPTMDWGLKAKALYGSYDRVELKAIANAPIIQDKLGLKIGGYLEQSDSFTKRASDGKRQDGTDRISLFGALRYSPNSDFDAILSVDYLDDDSQYPSNVPLTSNDQTFCLGFGACYDDYERVEDSGFDLALSEYPFFSTVESTNVSLNMSNDFGGVTLEMITGYIDQSDALDQENTGAAPAVGNIPLFNARRSQDAMQFSQEFRVLSDFDGAFNFVAGLYYMRSEYQLDSLAIVNGNVAQNGSAGQDLDAYAAYAETFVDITDALRLTVGGRYTIEKKRFDFITRDPATGAVTARCPDGNLPANVDAFDSCRDPSVVFRKFTPRVILDYHLTDDVMVYGSWSRGYRSGGWNGRATTVTTIGPYAPEQVDSYELGLRSTFLDDTLTFNLTGFYTDYTDKQEEIITASPLDPNVTQTLVQNAGAATIKGLEGELSFQPTSWLNLRSAVGYIDAEYDSFIQGGVDISDQRRLRYAPEWSVSVGGDANIPIGDDSLTLAANYKWTDDFFISAKADPIGLGRDVIEAYGTFDASIGYEGQFGYDKTWRVSAFVNDAFHDDGRVYRKVIAGPFSFGSREPGRTLGVEVGFEY